MIAFVDVGYHDDGALAACVVAERWVDDQPFETCVAKVAEVAPYEPGQFYLRELPCLLAVLGHVRAKVTTIVVDGYVFLDGDRPGLGYHLHEAVRVPIVGVAKTAFHGVTSTVPVTRGESNRPLFVSAIGVDVDDAACQVAAMHGRYRMPTLLRRVDRMTRVADTGT